jgi:hypothetical protein
VNECSNVTIHNRLLLLQCCPIQQSFSKGIIMSIKINSVSQSLVPPFAICSDGGADFVITTHGKHYVTVSRDGDGLTIEDVGAAVPS